jgi:hypothetical protein
LHENILLHQGTYTSVLGLALLLEFIARYFLLHQPQTGASFFDVSLISVFDTKDTFWKYTNYPVHDEVVAYISSVMEAEEIVDYND